MMMDTLKKSPLSHLLLAITFLVTGLFVCLIQGVMILTLKPFSPDWHRRLNFYVTYMLNSQLVFLVEWWSGSRCILYCDPADQKKYFGQEPMLVIFNHSYETDWLVGWLFCDRIKILGHAKVFMKKMLQYIPILGWTWKMQDIIFVERSWEKDKISLAHQLQTLTQYPVPYLITVFPEGTRFTADKHRISMEVAKSKGLPTLKHLLLPRTRGFVATASHLRATVPAVYDLTIAFDPKIKGTANANPSVLGLLRGEKITGHLLVRRIPMEEIPENENQAADWLQAQFRHKDKCLENFFESGEFNPGKKMREYDGYEYVELPRRPWSLINFVVLCTIIVLLILYVMVTTFMAGGYWSLLIGFGLLAAAHVGITKMINLTRIDKASSYGGKGVGGGGGQNQNGKH